jgi:predicted DNA-binding protein (MmcQ/YjbR family)
VAESFTDPLCLALRAQALALPEVSEGSSCVNRAFKARKKNFLFLGEKTDEIRIMVKLGPSLAAAEHQAADDARIRVGKHGWLTLRFAPDAPLPAELLGGWLEESYRLLAPKTLVKRLDAES